MTTVMAEGPTMVRITFFAGGQRYVEEYSNCFAVSQQNGRVDVRMYDEPPNAIPRAMYPADVMPVIEHFGPHRAVAVPSRPPVPPVATSPLEAPAVKAPPSVLPQGKKEDDLWNRFQGSAPSAEEQEQEYLKGGDADPKEEVEPSGSPVESTSVLPSVATPSGASANESGDPFTPKEMQAVAEVTGSWQPSQASRPPRNKPSRNRHGRAKTLPGATVLFVLALFLATSFRHSV